MKEPDTLWNVGRQLCGKTIVGGPYYIAKYCKQLCRTFVQRVWLLCYQHWNVCRHFGALQKSPTRDRHWTKERGGLFCVEEHHFVADSETFCIQKYSKMHTINKPLMLHGKRVKLLTLGSGSTLFVLGSSLLAHHIPLMLH